MSSGSAALASAKNRRSSSNIVKNTPNQMNNQVNSRNGSNQQDGTQGKPMLSPMQVLRMHEMRISKLERANQEINNSVKSLNTNVSAMTSQTQSNVSTTTSSAPVPARPSPTYNNVKEANAEVAQLRERVALLEEMFEHLKEDIFRVQTFAMETNITLMRVQNGTASESTLEETSTLTSEDLDSSDESQNTFNEKMFDIKEIQNMSR